MFEQIIQSLLENGGSNRNLSVVHGHRLCADSQAAAEAVVAILEASESDVSIGYEIQYHDADWQEDDELQSKYEIRRYRG